MAKKAKLGGNFVRIRKTGGSMVVGVPAAIARLISPETVFEAELVEEGLLFRYVAGQEKARTLPAWIQGHVVPPGVVPPEAEFLGDEEG